MWPLLLDMTKEESIQNLRNLELEAYSYLVSALRAQGHLSSDKRKLLKDTGHILNITQERHKAEVRRAISDEKLNTIAYHLTGHSESLDEWAQEGRRLVPLLPRTAPQTVFAAVADDAAEIASNSNKQLPPPSNTERKRTAYQIQPTIVSETSKSIPFRIPDLPKAEEGKKRKLISGTENSSLAQHLLSPKFCRIQQLYRQRSKQKQKDIHKKIEQEHLEKVHQYNRSIQPIQQTIGCSTTQSQCMNQKVNVLQNISLQKVDKESAEPERKDVSTDNRSEKASLTPICTNENHAPSPRHKIIPSIKPNSSLTVKHSTTQAAGSSNEAQKQIKMCAGKKTLTKAGNSGQKLIVVTNAQTIPTNSILQRTLQVPFVKNVSIKNFEKFKIVTSSSTPTTLHLTNVINSGMNSVKHKVVTVKTNPNTKKVIPLSQLQVLNSKGSLKVLPLSGKILGKAGPGTSSPLYIVNTTQVTKPTSSSQIVTTSKIQNEDEVRPNTKLYDSSGDTGDSTSRENGLSSVLEDDSKISEVISGECGAEDYDTKIEEFHIPQNRNINFENQSGEMNTIHSDVIKTELVQHMEYTVLPMHDGVEEEGVELTEIKDDLVYDEVNGMTNEIIESDNHVVEATELTKARSEISCEELPEWEYSKLNDINELY